MEEVKFKVELEVEILNKVIELWTGRNPDSTEVPAVISLFDRVNMGSLLGITCKRKRWKVEKIDATILLLRGFSANNEHRYHNSYNFNGVYAVNAKRHGTFFIVGITVLVSGSTYVYCYVVGNTKQLKIFDKAQNESIKDSGKPKLGIYRLNYNQEVGLIYTDLADNIPQIEVVHPIIDTIKQYVESYFKDPTIYMLHGRAGRKNVLLYGIPGTGKTSILMNIASAYKDKACITFSTDFATVAMSSSACAKYDVPNICIFEDCEDVLSANNADIKNFLSGIDSFQNRGGCIIFMTTNYPELIESSILSRRGRVDRILEIGALEDEYLDKCFEVYLKNFIDDPEKVQELINLVPDTATYTGSQVEGIVYDAVTIAAQAGKSLDKEHLQASISLLEDELGRISDMSKKKKKTFKMGFAR